MPFKIAFQDFSKWISFKLPFYLFSPLFSKIFRFKTISKLSIYLFDEPSQFFYLSKYRGNSTPLFFHSDLITIRILNH